jgi:hypothetical protein
MSPALAGEVSMPANKRRRRRDQTSAALLLEQSSERREERSVGPAELRPCRPATEDRKLVAQDQKLGFALEVIATTGEQAEGRTEGEEDESQSHPGILPTSAKRAPQPNPRIGTPQAVHVVAERSRLAGLASDS